MYRACGAQARKCKLSAVIMLRGLYMIYIKKPSVWCQSAHKIASQHIIAKITMFTEELCGVLHLAFSQVCNDAYIHRIIVPIFTVIEIADAGIS